MGKFNDLLLGKGEYDPGNTGVDDFLLRNADHKDLKIIVGEPPSDNALLGIGMLQYAHNWLLVGKTSGAEIMKGSQCWQHVTAEVFDP